MLCPFCDKMSVEICHSAGDISDGDNCDCCCYRRPTSNDIKKCNECNTMFHQCDKLLTKIHPRDYHHYECAYCIEQNRLINKEKIKAIKIILDNIYHETINHFNMECSNIENPTSFFGYINKMSYLNKGIKLSFFTCSYCFDKHNVDVTNYVKFLIVDTTKLQNKFSIIVNEKNIDITNDDISEYINLGELHNPSMTEDDIDITPNNENEGIIKINDAIVMNKRQCENYV